MYEYLTEEARRAIDTLGALETATVERIIVAGQLTTQQMRKAVWGLASIGLIIYQPGSPVRLSENGTRLVKLLEDRKQA